MSESNKNQNTKPTISICETTYGNDGNTPKILNPLVVRRLLTRRDSSSKLRKYCLSPVSRKRKNSNFCERSHDNDNPVLTNNYLQLSQCELISTSPSHKQVLQVDIDNLSRGDSNVDDNKEENVIKEITTKKKKVKFREDDPNVPFIDVVYIESYKKFYSNKHHELNPKIHKCGCGCMVV